MRSNRPKNSVIAISLLIVLVPAVFAVPRPAQAFLPVPIPIPTATTVDVPSFIERIIDAALSTAYNVFFRNQLTRFMQNAAYNLAIKLATGEVGQKPLFFDMSTVLTEAADQAAGEFAQQILNATGGKQCEVSKIGCSKSRECGLVGVDDNGNTQLVASREDAESKGLRPRRERCAQVSGGFLNLGGVDFCNFSVDPLATIRVQTAGLNTFNRFRPSKPRCSFSQLMDNVQDIKNIQLENLVDVATIFDKSTNEISAVLNINANYQEQRALSIAQQGLAVRVGRGIKAVTDKVTGKTKTPAPIVETLIEEGTIKFPFDNLKHQTGNIVADSLGVFTNTFLSEMLKKVFDTGFNPEVDSSIASRNLFGGLTGVAAARLKFADLLENKSIRQGGQVEVLQQLSTGCDVVSQSIGAGSAFNPEEIRQVNNCVIDFQFRDAIDQKLTIKQAVTPVNLGGVGLLDGSRDFGVHADGTGSLSLAGQGCDGCDPDVYSLRSIMVLRKYRVLPVGWEIAAQYIRDVLQKNNTDPAAQRSFTLDQVIAGYHNPRSPFYHLVDENWQLKAPATLAWRQGPGENKPVDFTDFNDLNNDGIITDDERINIISRITYTADERGCIHENPDGSCRFYGYCTEEKPIWRNAGEACEARFNTCQTFEKSSDGTRTSYLSRTTDQASCSTANAGCRRFSLVRSEVTGEWLDFANPEPEPAETATPQDIYIDSDAPTCDESAAGCSEFLRLTKVSGDPLTAAEIDLALSSVPTSGTTLDYQNFALVSRLYLNGDRVQCTGADTNNDGTLTLEEASVNVACRLYSPRSFSGPKVPGVVTFADVTLDNLGEVLVTNWNDECPAECVGYQQYEETTFAPLYPASASPKLISETAQSCSARAEGCTEFTNLNEVALGGEGLEYYTQVRECVTEDDTSQATFFTWEGSEDTGFQLRSWQLVALPDGSPKHSGDSDYELCNETIFNLPPEDPFANPDCREYLSGDLSGPSITRHYRLHSRVIFASTECRPLRRSNIADQATCEAANGAWESPNGCIYMTIPAQSQSCQQREVGCRRYEANAAGNAQTIFNDTFENGTTEGWTKGLAGNVEGLAISSESALLGGHSLQVDGALATTIERSVQISEGKTYVLSFWAKGASGVAANILGPTQTLPVAGSNSVQLAADWMIYSIGPFTMEETPNGNERLMLSGILSPAYFDNISLTESKDLFLISKSWTTPLTCDLTIDGDATNPDPHPGISTESQLGCEEYRDDQRNSRFIKSFTRLCEEEFVGCEALIDTHNSDLIAQQTFILSDDGSTQVTVPADEIAYFVNHRRNYCDSANVSCTELGLALVDREMDFTAGGVGYFGATFSNAYRIIDPDEFTFDSGEFQTLCRLEENLCDEYLADGEAQAPNHFKDPQDRVCEFRRNVLLVDVGRTVREGWFKINASPVTASDVCQEGDILPTEPSNAPVCNFDYSRNDFVEGTNLNVGRCGGPAESICNDDSECLGGVSCEPVYPPHAIGSSSVKHSGCYVYSCPAESSGCTEFQDPLLPEDCDINLSPNAGRCGGPGGIECLTDFDCPGTGEVECVPLACDYYYYIEESLQTGISECAGEIDPDSGCVGFWQTDNEDKFLIGSCQPGCPFELDVNDLDGDGNFDEPILVKPVSCEVDQFGLDPTSKPGCLNQ